MDVRTEYVDNKTRHQRVTYKFQPYVFQGIDAVEIKGASLMPQKTVDKIVESCLPAHPYRVDVGLMDKVREKIEKWCVFFGGGYRVSECRVWGLGFGRLECETLGFGAAMFAALGILRL